MAVPFLRGLAAIAGNGKRGAEHASTSAQLANTLLRLAHVPTMIARVSTRGLSTILKAKTLLTRVVVQLQHTGLSSMLKAMSGWRRGVGPHEQRFVVLGVCHAWDDTTQKLRESKQVLGERRSTQRVSQTVLVQKSMIQARCLQVTADGQISYFGRAENFLIPPLEVPGKSAADLRQVMLASAAWNGPICLEDRASMHNLAASVDSAILTFWPDGASPNLRWLKHVCAVTLRDEWPAGLLVDPQELCMIHQAHRIKVSCLEAQSMVGLLYCFSKLARSGAVYKDFTDQICEFVDSRLDIVVGAPPPAAATARSRRIFDLIYDLDGEHHSRGKDGARKSQLWHDVQALLELDNSGFSDTDRIVHYCVASGGKQCCQDAEDTKTKLKVAYIHLFVTRCWPEGTLSRWTHVRTLLGLVAAGFLCRGILRVALAPLLQVSEADGLHAQQAGEHLSADTAGAGLSDEVVQHRARKQKVQAWLVKPETPWQVAVVFLTTSILDRVTYFLMTGGKGAKPLKPGSFAKSEMPIEMSGVWRLIRDCRSAFLGLLREFDEDDSPTRVLLRSMGVSDAAATSGPCVLFLRRHALKMSIGLYRRFEVRFRTYPYKLWVLVDDKTSAEVKRAAIEEFHGLPSCCAGWFGSQLQRLFPTEDSLSSPLCRIVLTTWLATLIFSTYACEAEHASVRRIVGGSVGPARNFSLVARDRVLECTRAVHMERMHQDPRDFDELSSAAKRRAAIVDDDGVADNPLFPEPTAVEWREDGQPQALMAPPPRSSAIEDQGIARPLVIQCMGSWGVVRSVAWRVTSKGHSGTTTAR